MTTMTRLGNLESELSPRQRVLAWVAEWRDSASGAEYARHRFGDLNALANRMEQVRETVKRQHRGKPYGEVARRVRAAAQEYFFLEQLVETVNTRLTEHAQKVSYFPFLLLHTPEAQMHDICLLTACEIIGELAILRRISDEYFDGQQITYDAVIEGLELAERAWWLTLRGSHDYDTDRDVMQVFVQEYVDGFVRSIVTEATIETHEFFGEDQSVRVLRETVVSWARDALWPPTPRQDA
jgi:hypothetical protein